MSSAAVGLRSTPEQYLALERRAEFRNEYDNGTIRAMSGASRLHNLIAGNLYREVSSQFRDRPCEAFITDMRVRVAASGLYTYPDMVVVAASRGSRTPSWTRCSTRRSSPRCSPPRPRPTTGAGSSRSTSGSTPCGNTF